MSVRVLAIGVAALGAIACSGSADLGQEEPGVLDDAICGTNDLQNVESFVDTEDVTSAFITAHKGPVGRLNSGCSGTLLGDGLFLSVAHCRGATQVDMNYGADADGVPFHADGRGVPYLEKYPIVGGALEDNGVHQILLYQLYGNPEYRYGMAGIDTQTMVTNQQVAYIGHPYQLNHPLFPRGSTYKVAEVGYVASNNGTQIKSKHLDIRGGASGSGLLATNTGGLVGFLTGGRDTDNPDCGEFEVDGNWNTMDRLFANSAIVTAARGSLWGYTSQGNVLSHVSVDHDTTSTWMHIVPGKFNGTTFHNLFAYDSVNGTGQFFTVDSNTKTHALGVPITGMRKSWSGMVAAQFDGTGPEELLFYDLTTGLVEIYRTDGSGSLSRFRFGNINTRWTSVVAGDFTSRSGPEILFYNAVDGTAKLYGTTSNNITLLSSGTWLPGIASLVSGVFDASGFDTVLGYDGNANLLTFSGNTMVTNPPISLPAETFIQVVAGDFSFNAGTDVLFYAPTTGNAYLYNGGGGTITLSRMETLPTMLGKVAAGQFNNHTGTELFFYNRFRP